MPRSRVLDEIQRLDPVTDHQRIVFLSTRYDFPFDTTRSLEFALFRTFCVPTIGALLDRAVHARLSLPGQQVWITGSCPSSLRCAVKHNGEM